MTANPYLTEDDRNAVVHIAEQIVHGRVCFLFGVGMSIPSGSLGGKELSCQLIKQLCRHRAAEAGFERTILEIAGQYPLEAIAEGIAEVLPFKEIQLKSLLKSEVFGDNEPQINDAHKTLDKLVKRFNLRMLFTTNWDSLISDGLGASGQIVTEEDIYDLESIIRSRTAVIHLHGTFDKPLIRESDLMNPDNPLFQLLLAEMLTKTLVMVGYSMGDHIIRALYFKARDILERRPLQKNTYAVSPPRNEIDSRVSRATWRGRKVTYLPLSAIEFFELIYAEAVTNQMNELKNALRKKLGMPMEELNSKVEEILAVFPAFSTQEQVLLYLEAITRGGL